MRPPRLRRPGGPARGVLPWAGGGRPRPLLLRLGDEPAGAGHHAADDGLAAAAAQLDGGAGAWVAAADGSPAAAPAGTGEKVL